jgi:hypothetical protein
MIESVALLVPGVFATDVRIDVDDSRRRGIVP